MANVYPQGKATMGHSFGGDLFCWGISNKEPIVRAFLNQQYLLQTIFPKIIFYIATGNMLLMFAPILFD